VAVFLLGGLIGLHFLFSGGIGQSGHDKGILGGPAISKPSFDFPELAMLVSRPLIVVAQAEGQGSQTTNPQVIPAFYAASLKDPGVAIGPSLYRSNVIVYTVGKGENLGKIASHFGISVQTIVNSNPQVKAKKLKAGEELNILPVSGAVYKVQGGDTLASIALSFGVNQERIKEFNKAAGNMFAPGTTLVIPGGKENKAADSSLPILKNYFSMPADGFNWGILHSYNAVDIANACGTPVKASAEGLVVPDDRYGDGTDGWNGGYGKFVMIEHPAGDGVRTRYAHLDTIAVNIGTYVSQGQVIGTMGKTGDATGCHVHFEVYGAQNPFAK